MSVVSARRQEGWKAEATEQDGCKPQQSVPSKIIKKKYVKKISVLKEKYLSGDTSIANIIPSDYVES